MVYSPSGTMASADFSR